MDTFLDISKAVPVDIELEGLKLMLKGVSYVRALKKAAKFRFVEEQEG